jgi:hypothetical protein
VKRISGGLLMFRSICVIGVALVADTAPRAAAQTTQTPKERCTQLIDFFDYYGTSRKENSDGSRNHTRIGAEIDCNRGDYDQGIKAMEDLLRRKRFTVPPPPS